MLKQAKKSIRPLIALLAVSSCAVNRPNIQNCIVNAPNKNRKCYNLAADYNDDGTLKVSAKAVYKSNSKIEDLNKAFLVDSETGFEDGLAGLKAYIKELRQHYENCQSGQ